MYKFIYSRNNVSVTQTWFAVTWRDMGLDRDSDRDRDRNPFFQITPIYII